MFRKRFVEQFELLRSEGFADLSRNFLLSILSLHLDSQFSKESLNHRKIGDVNEALRICKQATQIASFQFKAFRSYQKKSEMISSEDCGEMAKVKLKYFI